MSVAMGASSPASPAGGAKIWRWDSATPYLLGSIVVVMLLITVALLMLLCSVRKERRRSAAALASGDKSVKGDMMCGTAVPMPEFVVIMAGEDRPTYLAMPAGFPSASITEAGGLRTADHTADP